MPETHYYRRSLALLRRDRGWVKPVLVLAAANLVPIVGALGSLGYAMEWARLTAWGVDSSPKQKDVKVGACIASGWRAFLVVVVPALAMTALSATLRQLTAAANVSVLSALVDLVLPVLGLAVSMFGLACALHATIYQDIKAGFCYSRLAGMFAESPGGIVKIALLYTVLNLILSLAVGILGSVTMLTAVTDLVSRYRMWGYSDVLAQVTWAEMFGFVADFMASLASAALPLALIVLTADVASVFVQLITVTSLGLWMREFDVPRWGGMHDPFPRPQNPQIHYLNPPTA